MNQTPLGSALPPDASHTADSEDLALRRSGAVARMLRMPVATLRVWERRYGVTEAKLSPSGQRLYSSDDVRRLALIKQLTELGHAIGSVAALDMAQLQQVVSTHAGALAITGVSAGTRARHGGSSGALAPSDVHAGAPTGPVGDAIWGRAVAGLVAPLRPLRLAVVGPALGARLLRPGLLRRLDRPLQVLGPFDSLAQAAAAWAPADLDAVLLQVPQLHADWLAACDAAAPAFTRLPRAVLYGFASESVCESLATAGLSLLREPQPDVVIAQWLRQLAATLPAPAVGDLAASAPPAEVPPQRWDEAALADFASRSSTVACECPRHVVELLVQLSHFERYSAECENRSPDDAALHAYLRQVAATSRADFEAAFERVALHEGLSLPSSAIADPAAPRPSA